MPLELNNATYKAFTDFASKVKDKTIASFGDEKLIKNESGLGNRSIVPSQNKDFIGNIGRFADKKEANNAVRALFRQSIVDMFGGESMIPASVKTAMRLGDYDKGKPLSARRIKIVKAAIDAVKGDMEPITIDKDTAKKLIEESEAFLGGSTEEFSNSKTNGKELAMTFLMTYGQGFPAKTARVLSNFIVNGILNSGDERIVFNEDVIKNVAEEMKTWDEFIFGDERFNDIGKEFMDRQNNYIKEKINKSDEFTDENPGIFKTMNNDANRFEWSINGKKFPLGTDKQKVINEFCKTVEDPKARKAISIIFNQNTQVEMFDLLTKNRAPDEKKKQVLADMPNANKFVSYDLQKLGFLLTKTANGIYDLKISEDGKTATITVTSIDDITNNQVDNKFRIGRANISVQSTIDLTKEIPEVTNVTFSQTFSPNELYKSA